MEETLISILGLSQIRCFGPFVHSISTLPPCIPSQLFLRSTSTITLSPTKFPSTPECPAQSIASFETLAFSLSLPRQTPVFDSASEEYNLDYPLGPGRVAARLPAGLRLRIPRFALFTCLFLRLSLVRSRIYPFPTSPQELQTLGLHTLPKRVRSVSFNNVQSSSRD